MAPIGLEQTVSYDFHSVFHQGTRIVPFAASDGNWRALIAGVDRRTKAKWRDDDDATDLPGLGLTSFRFQVTSGRVLNDYVRAQVRQAIGPEGTAARTLSIRVVKNDPLAASGPTRAKYILFSDTGKVFTEGYSRYKLKLQSNLASVQTDGLWREIAAWVNPEADRIVSVQVVNVGGAFRWRLLGKPAEEAASDWTVDNTSVPVPIGRLFLFEQAFTGEYIAFKANGNVIAEYALPYLIRVREWDVIACYSAATDTFDGQLSNFETGSGWTGLTTAFAYEGSRSAFVTGGVVPTLTFSPAWNASRYSELTLRALWDQIGGGNDPQLRMRFYTGAGRSDLDIATPSPLTYGSWFLRSFNANDAVAAVGGGADLTAVDKVDLFYSIPGFPLRSNLYVDDLRGQFGETGEISQEVADFRVKIGRGAIPEDWGGGL